ncbi:hypothetical protein [Streptomyces minutiscleroticus]|nr:hypothetical protein [Streptomyces minutiscleroticus]
MSVYTSPERADLHHAFFVGLDHRASPTVRRRVVIARTYGRALNTVVCGCLAHPAASTLSVSENSLRNTEKAEMNVPREPVVSIQQAYVSDVAEGHLAFAALVAHDCVAVPGPLDWLRDEKIPLEVLLIPVGGEEPGVVERIRPARAEIIGFASHPEGAVAFLYLAQPSRYCPTAGVLRAEDFEKSLSAGEKDMWKALEAAGGVPTRAQAPSWDAALRTVSGIEEAQRRELVRTELFQTAAEVAVKVCPPMKGCRGFVRP